MTGNLEGRTDDYNYSIRLNNFAMFSSIKIVQWYT